MENPDKINLEKSLEEFSISQAKIARDLGTSRQNIYALIRNERQSKGRRPLWERTLKEYFKKLSKKKSKIYLTRSTE